MCQYHKPEKTRRLAAKLKQKKSITGYKVLKRRKYPSTNFSFPEGLISPYHRHLDWKKGWNKADCGRRAFIKRSQKLGTQSDTYKSPRYKNVASDLCVSQGIHVFLDKKDADNTRERWNQYGTFYVVVPVTCYENDLISAGTSGMFPDKDISVAVFTKVYLKTADWQKALK